MATTVTAAAATSNGNVNLGTVDTYRLKPLGARPLMMHPMQDVRLVTGRSNGNGSADQLDGLGCRSIAVYTVRQHLGRRVHGTQTVPLP
jgi:hypothetical protein